MNAESIKYAAKQVGNDPANRQYINNFADAAHAGYRDGKPVYYTAKGGRTLSYKRALASWTENGLYAITCTDSQLWLDTQAKTLAGAKRLATREYGDGYQDAVIKVAWRDEDGRVQVLAEKKNGIGSKWREKS